MTAEKTALEMAKSWGWASPPDSILKIAALSVQLGDTRAGDAVVALGLLSAPEKEDILSKKPADRRTLEWLALCRPTLKDHIDRLLALRAGHPYFEDFAGSGLVRHSAMGDVAAHDFCRRSGCVVMAIEPSGPALLCFGTWEGLARWRQSWQSASNPIAESLGGQPLALAVANPACVAIHRAANAAGQPPLQDASASNHWRAAQTVDSQALARMSGLLDAAMACEATDIDIEPLRDGRGRVRFRVDGRLEDPPGGESLFIQEDLAEAVRFLAQRSGANPGASRIREPADGQMVYRSSVGEVFLRCSFIPLDPAGASYEMTSVALRVLPRRESAVDMERLNIPEPVMAAFRAAVRRPQGMILLAGPTNSGKSTTIAGLLGMHRAAHGASLKRIAIEDPVERFLPGVRQISLSRHTAGGFAAYFRSALRHDPDLITIGEIRDGETASVAVRSAASGHAVLSTVHASDAALAYKAIAGMIPEEQKFDLIESLSLIVGQRLMRRICPRCGPRWRRLSPAEQAELARHEKMQSAPLPKLERAPFQGEGCPSCRNTGFSGLLPVHEVLELSRELKDSLHSGRHQGAALRRHRSQSLAEGALARVAAGEILLESAFI